MLDRGSHKEALQNFETALHFDPKHRVRPVFFPFTFFLYLEISMVKFLLLYQTGKV